jgi:hypothetical protein
MRAVVETAREMTIGLQRVGRSRSTTHMSRAVAYGLATRDDPTRVARRARAPLTNVP